MSAIARSADRCYPISEKWFKSTAKDVPDYIDVREIRESRSAYVSWVIANDPNLVSPPTVAGHRDALNFTLNGIRVGEADIGPELEGFYAQNSFKTTMKYAGGINHPERYSRIYRETTHVRHLAFVGFSG